MKFSHSSIFTVRLNRVLKKVIVNILHIRIENVRKNIYVSNELLFFHHMGQFLTLLIPIRKIDQIFMNVWKINIYKT